MSHKSKLALYFTTAIILYIGMNFYVFLKGLAVIPKRSENIYLTLFLLLSTSYLAGRVLERMTTAYVSSVLVRIGSVWLAFLTYFYLAFFSFDTVLLVSRIVLQSKFWIDNSLVVNITWIIIFIVSIIVTVGYINARSPRLKTLNLTIRKAVSSLSSMTIAVASDIHLSTNTTDRQIKKTVDMINSINADVILLPGDIVDEDLDPVMKRDLGTPLKSLYAKYGVFAVTGNHEYIAGIDKASRYIQSLGITLLRDQVVTLNNSILLVGREDRERKERITLEQLLSNQDKSVPIIVMDHQPTNLDQAKNNKVDIQLSGHTHHGQMFPFNLITSLVYELSWGYIQKDQTHYYVSCGVGTWGPPIRTISYPEIIQINIQFGK